MDLGARGSGGVLRAWRVTQEAEPLVRRRCWHRGGNSSVLGHCRTPRGPPPRGGGFLCFSRSSVATVLDAGSLSKTTPTQVGLPSAAFWLFCLMVPQPVPSHLWGLGRTRGRTLVSSTALVPTLTPPQRPTQLPGHCAQVKAPPAPDWRPREPRLEKSRRRLSWKDEA